MIFVLRPMSRRSWREELAARGSPEELFLFHSTLLEEPLLFVPTFPEELLLFLPVLSATLPFVCSNVVRPGASTSSDLAVINVSSRSHGIPFRISAPKPLASAC